MIRRNPPNAAGQGTRPLSIIDFIDDPALLGPHFAGPTWDRWRAVLRAAFALPMSEADLALFAEVSGGRAPPSRPVRQLVCAVGRGGGKDAIASALATYIAATSDFSRLRVGERATVLCLATDRDQAAIAHGYVAGYFETVPALGSLVERISNDTIELRNGAEVIVGTNSMRAPRGRTICCAIYDECAFWFEEDSANPDVEVDTAVSPGLMRFPGSLKILISSVNKRSGLLYDRVTEHFGHDSDDVLVVMGESLQFNPTLDADAIERELRHDPERAGAEYLCRWRDDLSSFLDRQLVEVAIDRGVAVRPPRRGIFHVAFADPSGGRGDSFTLGIAHAEGDAAVLDCLYERRAPFDPSAVVAEIVDLLRAYGTSEVTGDRYAAGWVTEGFAKHGITYRASDRDKSAIYLDALPLFTAGQARILDSERLVHQLISLERRATRIGRDIVSHPDHRNAHDDLANSAAGALVLAASETVPALWRRADLLGPEGPAAWPCLCQMVFASLAADEQGITVLYWGRTLHGHLLLIDFDTRRPFSAGLWSDIRNQLHEFAAAARARCRLYTTSALAAQARVFSEGEVIRHLQTGNLAGARRAELPVEAVDGLVADRDGCLLACASAIGQGRVRIAEPAQQRSLTHPLPLADLRPGVSASAGTDAALIGVAAATVDLRSLPRATTPSRRNPHGASAGQAAAR